MSDSIFFSGRIEEAIQATVANQKPLACFVTDEGDDGNLWENDYLSDDSVSTSLKTSAVTVRLLKDSTEANYLNAFCSITTYPTLLIIKNGGAGVGGLTVITNPISKEEFIAKISSTFSNLTAPANLLDGVNSSPSFPTATPTATTPSQTTTTTSPPPQEPTPSTSDSLPANTQFPPESDTGRRLASIQAQHRERIARLKAQREAAELEAQKKRELSRREDTQAMAAAAEAQKSRSNKQYADEQKKKKMEAEKERRRVLEQIKADREEMRIREANRKAIAAEAEAAAAGGGLTRTVTVEGKGKEVPSGGQCNLAFRLFDGSRISNKFPADATIEGDVRPWLDNNRTDSNHPYKLVVQSSGMSSKNIEGTSSSLSELGLYPSAILILKPIASSKVSSAFAPARRSASGVNNQQNFLIAFLLSIWLMIKTFLGLHDPSANVVVGEKKDRKEKSGSSGGSEDEGVTAASSASVSTPVVSRDVAKKRIRTLHDGDGDKRSAYYNGNQLDFEPKKKEGEEE
ncbi:uncharacterized protein DFL_001141 [Arthrobotrys flagrans]|uniref:UBX domain-containing protein 2 n=1 Tax=Arthrobotrys flagrans TaxID=97331 RepID=A0A437AG99_ARTFL|nr:hypothetical protein DFL_001141 [Arthrobotrys flagrans]